MVRLPGATAWLLALVLVTGLAAFQRLTGPTRPLRGSLSIDGLSIGYRLPRSHGGEGGLRIRVETPEGMDAVLVWRRFPTAEPWRRIPMRRQGGLAQAEIPHHPPAGKVEYRVELVGVAGERHALPPDRAAVARFKGAVPAWALAPHIAAMFAGFLIATRAALGAATGQVAAVRRSVVVAGLLLVVGGLVLGPVVQNFAFGAFWTGWPVGDDLTDTKTLVAVLAWAPAVAMALRRRRSGRERAVLLCGWMVLMAAFLIPHSSRGSELDWSDVPPPPATAGPEV